MAAFGILENMQAPSASNQSDPKVAQDSQV